MPIISIGMAECPHCLNRRWIIVSGANVCAVCGRPFELKPASDPMDRVRRREELLAPVLAAGGPEARWEPVTVAGEEDPSPRSSWQPDSEWRRGEPAAGAYTHHETGSRRGAEWALGVMPVLMLAVQYGVTFALVKIFGLSTALFGSLSALGIACTIVGLVIVYRGTRDISLTVGYVVVRWIESFFVGFVLSAALIASLGLQAGSATTARAPTGTSPVRAAPRLSGAAPAPTGPSSRSVNVINSQGLSLNLTGNVLTIALPSLVKVNGQLVTLQGSVTRLECSRVHGRDFSLAPQLWQPGSDPVAWRLSGAQVAITQCSGSVTVAHGGLAKLNPDTRVTGVRLDPWITRLK
jgi:hypothetical protein